MNAANYIHIALLGPVSAGKTTLLNALLVERYGDMAMKRTTMTEAIYYEREDEKHTTAADIHAKNAAVNAQLYEKAKSGGLTAADLKPIEHFVPPVHDLLTKKLHAGTKLAIHDLPGLNDAQTKTMYHDYVAANFHKYNIVILVLDVNSGMNTSDEKDILTLIMNCMNATKAKFDNEISLIIAINKCDDMEVRDHNSGETVVTDPEYIPMIKQVRTTVESTVRSCNLTLSIPIRIICIAAEDSYIYRMYSRNPRCGIDPKHRNKFGINAFGKLTWAKMTETEKIAAFQLKVREKNVDAIELAGFRHLDWKLTNILTPETQFKFLIAPLKIAMTKIWFSEFMVPVVLDTNVREDIRSFRNIKAELHAIATKFGKTDADPWFVRYFDSYLTKYEKLRETYMLPMIVQHDDYVTHQTLKNIHDIMTIVRVDMMSWLLTPRSSKLGIIATSANTFIVNSMKNVSNTSATIHDLVGRIIFPTHSVDTLIHLLPYTKNTAKVNLGVNWRDLTAAEGISIEMCTGLWTYGKIPWHEKLDVVNNLLTWFPIETRIKLVLHNVRMYLEFNSIGDGRWDALEVYSSYYINSDIMAGNLGFGSTDVATIKKYLRLSPASARTLPLQSEIVADIAAGGIAHIIRHCMTELSKIYSKHIVDLDEFYGAPRGGPDLDEFY